MTKQSPIVAIVLIAVVICAVGVIFWPTVMVLTTQYDTYRHIGVVLLAFVVLVWHQRFELLTASRQPFWPGIFVMMGVGFTWLLGELLFIRILTDMAVVAMVSATVLTAFGYRWLWALSFPLSFLFFAIPMGGPLVPTLVNWTAKFSVLALQVSGVPIFQEGAYFMIPSGSWSIAEACSGIGYFSTCVMLGCLYAKTLYRSPTKRIAFIAGATLIGVVGNWIRVYLTVIIAHLSDNRYLRDDHSTFGWIVFAFLAFFYCWIGLKFRDDDHIQSVTSVELGSSKLMQEAPRRIRNYRNAFVVVVVLMTLAFWPLARAALKQHLPNTPVHIADIKSKNGWHLVNDGLTSWTPQLQNPSGIRIQTFEKAGRRVSTFVGIFQNQTWNSKLVTSVNQFVSDDNPEWKLFVHGVLRTNIDGQTFDVNHGVIDGRKIRIAAWQWYWIDGVATGNGAMAKVQQLQMRLRGKTDASAWVALYCEADVSVEIATATLVEFAKDMGRPLHQALAATMP